MVTLPSLPFCDALPGRPAGSSPFVPPFFGVDVSVTFPGMFDLSITISPPSPPSPPCAGGPTWRVLPRDPPLPPAPDVAIKQGATGHDESSTIPEKEWPVTFPPFAPLPPLPGTEP